MKKILIALVGIGVLIGGAFLFLLNREAKPLKVTAAECINEKATPNVAGLELPDLLLKASAQVYKCSHEVVLAPRSADYETLLSASYLASSTMSPLLLYEAATISEIRNAITRLKPVRIIYISASINQAQMFFTDSDAKEVLFFEIGEKSKLPAYVRDRLKSQKLESPIDLSVTKNQQALKLWEFNDRLVNHQQATKTEESISITSARPVWIFSNMDSNHAVASLPLLHAVKGSLYFAGQDVRATYQLSAHIQDNTAGRDLDSLLQPIGNWSSESLWQLEVLKRSAPLPSGKHLLFSSERMVAFYGIIGVPRQGVLGTYLTPADALDGLRPYLANYQTPDITVTPVFEIITTVADSQPGEDGDFSREISVDQILPWVEAARELGVYVVLDLQSGRTDFLTQAKKYERLLKYEHVGLALDPEWRLKPHEFHLWQVGTVDADEVNQVVEWMAKLVRENYLPQKLLLLHQFQIRMIRNRADIASPTELAIVVHMDGQGALEEKFGTYSLLAVNFPNEPKRFFGWKNFFFADNPTPTPEIVLSRQPIPDFISYQ